MKELPKEAKELAEKLKEKLKPESISIETNGVKLNGFFTRSQLQEIVNIMNKISWIK